MAKVEVASIMYDMCGISMGAKKPFEIKAAVSVHEKVRKENNVDVIMVYVKCLTAAGNHVNCRVSFEAKPSLASIQEHIALELTNKNSSTRVAGEMPDPNNPTKNIKWDKRETLEIDMR
jgi:hypothetical protein